MTRSDSELIDTAAAALGLVPVSPLRAGFQKLVWQCRLGADDVVLKVSSSQRQPGIPICRPESGAS